MFERNQLNKMSATTSAERMIFVDRLMSKSWISVAVTSIDKLACLALDTIDASWEVLREPVTEVVETAAFSSLGQFTIGCLESGVNITANVLDAVLPVDETEPGNDRIDQEGKAKKKSSLLSLESKKKTKSRDKRRRVHPIRTVSTSVKRGVRNVQKWLLSLKVEGHDVCGHCAKRRKVVVPRRLGPFHSLAHISVDAFTSPLRLLGLNVNWDVLTCVFTLSGNADINKSPVRPKSASEKRRFDALSSSDEDEIIDDIHRFHDDLGEYRSDEDADYEQPDIIEEAYDTDEYAVGETESDVSLDESPAPLKPREAKIAAQMAARKAAEDVPDGLVRPSNKKDKKQHKSADQSQEAKKSPKKDAKKSGNKEGKASSDKENKVANEKEIGKDGKNVTMVTKEPLSKKGSETSSVNGQMDKDITKGFNDGKTGKSAFDKKTPISPLRKLVGI